MKKCYFCRGEIQEQPVDVIRKRKEPALSETKGQVFIIENVPALVCQRCGERYYTAEVARTMDEKIAEGMNKTKRIISVPILSFDADYEDWFTIVNQRHPEIV